MNGLDSFFGLDQPEGAISAEKVREYKARMQSNQKAMVASRQQEQRQKKKEDNLAVILLRFIQTNQRGDVTALVSRCLEENMPAVFILAILMLGNEALQKELGIQLEAHSDSPDAPEAPGGIESQDSLESAVEAQETLESLENPETKGAMVVFGHANHAFPLKMRMTVDLWGKNIWEAISPIPERMFKTACVWNDDPEADPEPKEMVTQLAGMVLRDYFHDNHFDAPADNLDQFSIFLMAGLFKRLKEQVKNQHQLGGEA